MRRFAPELGTIVYAGARKDTDLAELGKLKNVQPVRLDVTKQARWTIRKQIEQLVQLNEGQTFTYDRETLIKMLDEALVGSRPRVQ